MVRRAGKIPSYLRSRISLAVDPWHWLSKARQLRKAADHLFVKFEEEQEVYNEAFEKNPARDADRPDGSIVKSLIGFAVETLLKGLYVSDRSHSNDVKSLKELKIPGRGHELNAIADAISVMFSKEEREILDALEHAVLWSGRYPRRAILMTSFRWMKQD